jgi:hypothetical protein
MFLGHVSVLPQRDLRGIIGAPFRPGQENDEHIVPAKKTSMASIAQLSAKWRMDS